MQSFSYLKDHTKYLSRFLCYSTKAEVICHFVKFNLTFMHKLPCIRLSISYINYYYYNFFIPIIIIINTYIFFMSMCFTIRTRKTSWRDVEALETLES